MASSPSTKPIAVSQNPTADTQSEKSTRAVSSPDSEAPPDGGAVAWMVILAIFGINLGSGGYLVAWGTFQAFYEGSILRTSSSSAIAWIGSLQGLVSGRLLDAGYFKTTLLLSCVALTISNFTVPECHKYYQFLLSQGILYGLGNGFLYTPNLALISHYFDKKRPIAYAIVTSGAAIGGILYPIMFSHIEPRIGFSWTMRIFAFFQLFFFVFGLMIIKPRRSSSSPRYPLSQLLDIRGITATPTYITYILATFLAFMALFTPLTFMTVKANKIGISSNLGFYLISIVNAATIPGRFICGLAANRFGALNLTILTTILSIGFILGWGITESRGTYIGMAICYGITSGGFLGLFAVPVAQMGTVQEAGIRTGVQMSVVSIGALIGPPISGAIQGRGNEFTFVGVFAAVTMFGSAALMIVAKYLYLGREKFLSGIF